MISGSRKPRGTPRERTRHGHWHGAALLALILLTATIRAHLLDVPLERDEGEYAYAGQLILQGIPPYAQVYNMKMPGIYAAYALILALFGQTHFAIHLALLVINAATTLLLYLLATRVLDSLVGIAAAGAFALFSTGQFVQGAAANAEHFVILPALGGVLLLVRATDSDRRLTLMASALLFGLAFLMKQHGAAFALFGGLYLLTRDLRRRPFSPKNCVTRLALFVAGALLPFVLTCLALRWCDVFDRFWFWTFEYARKYASGGSLADGLHSLQMRMARIAGSAILLWILAGIGLTALLWSARVRRRAVLVAGFSLFSFLAICPGLYFRPHYFILLLPAVALLTGIGAGSIYSLVRRIRSPICSRGIPILLAVGILGHTLYQQREFFFAMTPTEVSRATYGANPFPESLKISQYIRTHSHKDDRIAVVGSEPQIYFYANRRYATGYIYTYALMEDHPYALRMQQEMIREIEAARPKFLVFVSVSTSWLLRRASHTMIFEWFEEYRARNYDRVGVVDILWPQAVVYRWGDDARRYQVRSKCSVVVFKRRGPDEADVGQAFQPII